MTRTLGSLSIAALALAAAVVFAADPAKPAAPTTAPADVSQPTTAPAEITPEAATVLKGLGETYSKLKRLDLVGSLAGDFDVAGRKENNKVDFSTAFAAPNKFRHDVKDEALLGSTGEKFYIFMKEPNMYLMKDAPKSKVMSDELPDPFAELIGGQNLSLVLALSQNPSEELTRSYRKIEKSADVKVDDKTYTALAMSNNAGSPKATLLIDPATNLVRRATIDISDQLLSQGAPEVKKAQVTIDYTSSTPDAAAEPASDAFAWAPPAGAKDAEQMQQQGGEAGPAAALEGKPAPDFKLKGLDDKEVALADLKGQVVVLDFWATWCGPCVASLPKIDKLHQEKKDAGVKVFAVNLREDKELVQGFMTSKKLSLPVLLDNEGATGDAYQAQAIPQTVVIAKDGTIAKVFVGAGPNTEAQIREAVETALKAK